MSKLFPMMDDRPETSSILAALVYMAVAFFTLPFLLLLLMTGSFDNYEVITWGDIGYHVMNFLVLLPMFRSYLEDSLLNVQLNVKHFVTVTAGCVAFIVIYAVYMFCVFYFTQSNIAYLAFASLPLCETELFTNAANILYYHPIAGIICTVLIAPVTISIVYYATAFAPVCNNRPWLAYITVALILAFPRICNGMTFWNPQEEFYLYLVQLPIHLIACWGYQVTDTIWTPIAIHSVINMLSSAVTLWMYFM